MRTRTWTLLCSLTILLLVGGLAAGAPAPSAAMAAAHADAGLDGPPDVQRIGERVYRSAAAQQPTDPEQEARVWLAVQENVARLTREGKLDADRAASVTFGWPLRAADNLSDSGFHSQTNFFDHNPAYPNQLQDWNCGGRTYDKPDGYNHDGLDLGLYPFPWLKLMRSQVEVVAAADGTIVYKQDGQPEHACPGGNTYDNHIVLQHADGSQTAYGHLRPYSLNPKAVGESVAAGELLGIVGSSGTGGPHLHFDVTSPEGETVDPFAGSCNPGPSLWIEQRPYYDSAINTITVGNNWLDMPQCEVEDPHFDDNFGPGEAFFISTFYRELLGSQQTRYTLYSGSGAIVDQETWSNTDPYWEQIADQKGYTLSSNPTAGTWRWTAEFEGELHEVFFNVNDPTYITVTSPGEDAVWEKGSTQEITWEDNLGGPVRIELVDSDNSLRALIARSTPSDGTESWVVPADLTPGDFYRVRIVNITNEELVAYSDGYLEITGETADLGVVKTIITDPVLPDNEIQYRIAVTNNGPDEAQNVVMTDIVAWGYYQGASGDGWTCVQDIEEPSSVSCRRPSLPVGPAPDIVLRAWTPPNPTTFDNTAYINSDTADPVDDNNQSTVHVTVGEGAASADLEVIKTVAANPVPVNGQIEYKIAVTNHGPDVAENVVVADVVTSGDYRSISGEGWDCAQDSNDPASVSCARPTLAVGEAPVITLLVDAPAAPAEFDNTAEVWSDASDPNPNNDPSTVHVSVMWDADLSITMTDSPDPVETRGNLRYTLYVENLGPTAVEGVRVRDALIADAEFVSAGGDGWTCAFDGSAVECDRGEEVTPVGLLPELFVDFYAPQWPDTITNTASVSGESMETNTANNQAQEETEVVRPTSGADLQLTKNNNPTIVDAGSEFTYYLSVWNNGPNYATNITVEDPLPAAVTFISASGDGWNCAYSAGLVRCTHEGLPSSGGSAVEVKALAPSEGGEITNTATVSAETEDPDEKNNTATLVTTIMPVSDLSLSKSDSPDPVTVGGALTYKIAVSNAGPSIATALRVEDQLPSGVTFVSVTGDGWNCWHDAGFVICTRDSLAVGAAPEITIQTTAPGQPGTLNNTATISGEVTDRNDANNTDSEQTTVVASADLSITKSDTVDPVVASSAFAYQLSVRNAGPASASSVTVEDTLPSGVTFASATGDGWSCSYAGGKVTCSRATLAVAYAPQITIQVTAPAEGGTLTNTATVSAAESDPVSANNTDREETTITASADLSITKTDSPDPVMTGGALTYKINVSNAGPSSASSVKVEDALPSGVTFTGASGDGWSCSQASGKVTCTRASLGVVAAPEITIQVAAPSQAGTLNNTATVSAATPDPNTANNSANAQTTMTAGGCGSKCLRSTSITLAMRGTSLVTVDARVTVKDERGYSVANARVDAVWTLPYGSKQTVSAYTNRAGIAAFTVRNGRGTYVITVNNIVKSGYTFDPANSVLTNSIKK